MLDDEIVIKNRTDLDFLLVNIEAAVRVKRRPDFFTWVQGVFQGMLSHEILICALADPSSRTYRMEWMASRPLEESRVADLCGTSGSLMHRLIGLWEKSGRQPLLIGAGMETSGDQSLLAEIDRLDLDNVLAHGVPDLEGRANAFFSFSKVTGTLSPNLASMLELTTPYLHSAWVRANCEAGKNDVTNRIHAREILTLREVEILKWVEQGKSNSEIGQILSISHLTVKNHVQKILRKLNVQNRAQAVAKGINLNITRQRAY